MVVGDCSTLDPVSYGFSHSWNYCYLKELVMSDIILDVKNKMLECGYEESQLQFWMKGDILYMRIGFWNEIDPDAHFKLANAGIVFYEDRYEEDDCKPRYSYELNIGS